MRLLGRLLHPHVSSGEPYRPAQMDSPQLPRRGSSRACRAHFAVHAFHDLRGAGRTAGNERGEGTQAPRAGRAWLPDRQLPPRCAFTRGAGDRGNRGVTRDVAFSHQRSPSQTVNGAEDSDCGHHVRLELLNHRFGSRITISTILLRLSYCHSVLVRTAAAVTGFALLWCVAVVGLAVEWSRPHRPG